MNFKELSVTNGLDSNFKINLPASSSITDIKIEGDLLKVKYLDSGFMNTLDVYTFNVFVIGEKGDYGSLGVNDEIVEGYKYYGKKYYGGSYLFYFGKQTDRIKFVEN